MPQYIECLMENTNTLEILQRWADFGIIIALGLSFGFGAANIILGHKLSKAKDVKIEEARADSAKANKETEKLAQENIKLRTDLESATAEARSRQSELTVEQQKLAKAQQKLAEAEQKRAEAQLALEKTLEEVRKRQMPRTLTPEQRTRLLEKLRSVPHGKISIGCVLGDGEGYAFAAELDGLLKAAGWTIADGGINHGVYTGNPKGNPKGTIIVVRDAKTAPKYAVMLQQAFAEVGLPMAGEENPKLPEGEVVLIIGNKP